MNFKTLASTAALTSLITVGGMSIAFAQPSQVVTKESSAMSVQGNRRHGYEPETKVTQIAQASAQEMKDTTGLTIEQKIAKVTQHKGQFGGGDELRRYFFGDLEPIGVQPGGAGMVVNLYNKANNVTFSYCATYDVVVAVKQGKVTKFSPSEVK